MLELVSRDGQHLEWISESQARALIKSGGVRLLRTKRRIRKLMVVEAPKDDERPNAQRPSKYSHNHDVAETYLDEHGNLKHRHPLDANVRGCWTLRRLDKSLKPIFDTVVHDCIPKSEPASPISIETGRTGAASSRRRRSKKTKPLAA